MVSVAIANFLIPRKLSFLTHCKKCNFFSIFVRSLIFHTWCFTKCHALKHLEIKYICLQDRCVVSYIFWRVVKYFLIVMNRMGPGLFHAHCQPISFKHHCQIGIYFPLILCWIWGKYQYLTIKERTVRYTRRPVA